MKIFISYRRADSTYIVGRIKDRLVLAFGEQSVFRDLDDIPAGVDFTTVLEKETNECKVMLVIIGPQWAGVTDSHGNKRLFDPNDYTRIEVETAMKRLEQKANTVIPVLVMNATMPSANELPESLSAFTRQNALPIRNDPDFNNDIEKLIRSIKQLQGISENPTRKHFEPETIYVGEGPFWMGSNAGVGIPDYETPQYQVILPAYYFGIYPVKNSEYEMFITQTKRQVPSIMGWDGQRVLKGFEDHPITGVTWYEALAYCEWLSDKTGRKYTLPNEAQWEKACRAGAKCIYPWGDEFDVSRCNHGQSSVASVKEYLAQNEYGIFDLVGNVLQWTSTLWGKKRFPPDLRYAYPWKEDGRNDLDENSEIRRVVRGSSMNSEIISHRCSARSGQLPEDRGLTGGRYSFRVVMDI